jgi:hypothetical protein
MNEKILKDKFFGQEPIIRLNRIIGFTGKTCPDLKWRKDDSR